MTPLDPHADWPAAAREAGWSWLATLLRGWPA
jgi:hypothetical protein